VAGQETAYTPGRAAHIRSFVRRQGRVSNAQQRYHEDMMAKIGVAYVAQRVDFETLFGRAAPRILEIGFGMGETSAAIAALHPESDYLGIEVHTPGVGSLCKLVAERALHNLRIIQHDAVEVVRDMISPASLAGVHVFFPDPWPKKRHHKRRLLQPPLWRCWPAACSRMAISTAPPTGKTTLNRCWPCLRQNRGYRTRRRTTRLAQRIAP